MRDVLFGTCFVENETDLVRYQKWLDYYENFEGKIVLVDDGSNVNVLWKLHLPIYEPETKRIDADRLIIHFDDNLGRPLLDVFPGWWRSFSFMAEFGIRFNVDRLIHIETDTYILSERLWKRLRESGKWCAPYSREMLGAESSIQVIPRHRIPALWEFWKAGKRFWFRVERSQANYVPEYVLPVEEYWFDLTGGRLGEDWWQYEIPMEVDYVANLGAVSKSKIYTSLQWKIDLFFERLKQHGFRPK